MMQWVTYVSLGLVFIVSTTHGEENASVHDVANDSSSEFPRPCVPGEFQCQSGKCIPLVAVCDNVEHCAGGEDEQQNCECEYHCESGRYSWWEGSRDTKYSCILNRFVCDGYEDCMDGEDEADCDCALHCDAGYWNEPLDADYRKVEGCLLRSQVCNGMMDCVDGQDEQNCPCDFQCNTAPGRQHCIKQRQVCNNWRDCNGGEDEENCPCEFNCEKGTKYSYYDKSGSSYTCIKLEYVCDKEPDCTDGQDEVGCNY